MKAWRQGSVPGRQAGTTLMETLVTLVIVSMVAGLVAEGLFQIARAERSLSAGQMESRLEALHAIWVRDALEGLLVSSAEPADQLVADASTLRGVTTLSPLSDLNGPHPLRLKLLSVEGQALSRLVMQGGAGRTGAATSELVLLEWPTEGAHWQYLDDQGQVSREWPAEGRPQRQALPRSIQIVSGDGKAVLLMATPAQNYERLYKRGPEEQF